MNTNRWVLSTLCLLICLSTSLARAAEPMKEWTFLTFLNGHNNLDRFGTMNMNQMKAVGSTDQVNIVVQWASSARQTTQRVYVRQGAIDIVQDLPRIDMGDYKQLVEFVRWGAENFPAKHYFVNVWNHGGGWHQILVKGDFQTNDISWDDFTGHHITTEQLGVAMSEIQSLIGQKVDILGNDACLMAMAEVASELSGSVDVFAASQETEPGAGWPYTEFLRRWVAAPESTPAQVGTILAEEYLKSYTGGSNGRQSVTFSILDINALPGLWRSVTALGNQLSNLPAASITQVKTVANATQRYAYSDYKDIGDFVTRLEATPAVAVSNEAIADVKAALSATVISNQVSTSYARSHGVSIWVPTYSSDWGSNGRRYEGLRFDRETGWSTFLKRFF